MTENGKSDVMCACAQSISKQDWQDHQIVCTRKRYACPAYISFISNTKSNEYSLSLVDSNCPPSLKELAKLQVLKCEKDDRWLESNKIPFMIIHTLRKECPTFGSKQELIKHIENVCPYWKVKCLAIPNSIVRNSHKEDKCSELSRREFDFHSTESALDPISQRIRAIPQIFPYYCKKCDQHFPSSGTHICIKETNPINDDSEILCPGCKSVIRVKFNKMSQGIENTCEKCYINRTRVGMACMIPFKYHEKETVKWKN